MRACPAYLTLHSVRPVLAPRPALRPALPLRAHVVPPEPTMPPPPTPDLPTGVPPVGDPLPDQPAPTPGPAPGPAPDMPPEVTRAARAGVGQDEATHGGMMTHALAGRVPRFERPSTYRRSLLRAMSGLQAELNH